MNVFHALGELLLRRCSLLPSRLADLGNWERYVFGNLSGAIFHRMRCNLALEKLCERHFRGQFILVLGTRSIPVTKHST